MDNLLETFAATLQKYRKRIGLTQEGLAERLGVTFQAISKWENAKAAPYIFFLPVLADLFSCSIDELFCRGNNQAHRIDKIVVNNKEYLASYYGAMEMSSWSEYVTMREYWRLEDADDLFKKGLMTTDVLPYSNYPAMNIEVGDVFCVDYHRKDVKLERLFYIADGTVWQNLPSTRRIII